MGKVGIHAFLQMKTHICGMDQKGGEPSALSPHMTSTNMMLMRRDVAQIGPAGKSPRKRTEETGLQLWEVRDLHKTAREQRMDAKEQIKKEDRKLLLFSRAINNFTLVVKTSLCPHNPRQPLPPPA